MEKTYFYAYGIEWDTHNYEEYGYSLDPIFELPHEVLIPIYNIVDESEVTIDGDSVTFNIEDLNDEEIDEYLTYRLSDNLSDEYCWCIHNFNYKLVYED